MNFKSLLATAAFTLVVAPPGLAAPIDLDFSFAGLTGTFFGLDNADGISSASSVVFDGGFDSYAFDTTGSAANQFTFVAGFLTDLAFTDLGPHVGSGGNARLTSFDCFIDNCITSEQTIPFGAFFDVTGSPPVFTQRSVSAVPLPAGGVLIISGFIGLVSLRRRK